MRRETVTIEIPGRPVSKRRARISGGRMYSDQADLERYWKMMIRAQINRSGHIFPIPRKIPVTIDATYIFPIVAGASKAYIRRIEAGAIVEHVVKPDKDNLEKWVKDCLSKGTLYHDDAQVWSCSGRKYYGIEPKTLIVVSWKIYKE